MALVPISYNLRSLWVRRSSTLLTIVSIGATVAVLAGVLALQQGFERMFADGGREGVVVFVRPSSTNEGDSAFRPELAEILIKGTPEIETNAKGQPIAAAESYLAVLAKRVDGSLCNVPIRGVQPMSFEMNAERTRWLAGQAFVRGTDEIAVGKNLVGRIQQCEMGGVIVLNTTPFRVAGVFETGSSFDSEIWGDLDRMRDALERDVDNRVIARLRPGVDLEALATRLKDNKETPADVYDEGVFLSRSTELLSATILLMGAMLALIMGIAAVFTGTNAMLAAISSRTSEIGVLLSIGFRPSAIFASFLFESVLLGLLGGVVGSLVTLPLDGIRTGTMNFATFTESAFAFRITPQVLVTAIVFALLLGLIGGTWPAWRASRLRPTSALRRT